MDTETTEIAGLSKLLQDNAVMHLGHHDHYTICDLIELVLEQHNQNDSFYIVDLGEIVRRYRQWIALLPMVKPYYAVKCNPNTVICKLLALLGTGFDVASKNEINIVKNEAKYGDIIYAHPYKDWPSLQYARAADIDLSVFDSIHELDKIKLFHPLCQLLLRIKVDDKHSVCQLNTKFGAELPDVAQILQYAKTVNLNVIGVSFHVGSDCQEPRQYYQALQMTKQVFDIAHQQGLEFYVIDVGGGFPGKRGSDNDQLFIQICDNIRQGLADFFSKIPNLKVMAEPGRYFVQASHTLVVNIIGKNVKIDADPQASEVSATASTNVSNKRFIYYINDGVYGSFNCIFFDHAHPEIFPYNERHEDTKYHSVIFGRTCDSIDKICDDLMLPQLEIDDYCYVPNFGAYTVAASTTFNGFPAIKSYYVMTS